MFLVHRLVAATLMLFALSAHAVDLNEHKEREYWKEITFTVDKAVGVYDISPVDRRLKPNFNCYRAPEVLIACLRGTQAAGAMLTVPQTLIPKAWLSKAGWAKVKLVRDLGLMAIVEGQEDGKSASTLKPAERVAKIKIERDELLATASELIKINTEQKIQQVDFRSITLAWSKQIPADITPSGKVAVGIIGAFMLAIDAHSHFNLAKQMEDERKDADITLVGIGAELTQQDGLPMVIQPIADSPAEKTGLKSGDLITKVDGISTKGMSLDLVVDKIRGVEDTPVVLEIQRGAETLNPTIVRAKIVQKNVVPKVLEEIGPKIAYIKLRQFMDPQACDKISASIKEMEAKNSTEALILDLRGNGGGLLNQAVCIGGLFAGKQPVAYEKYLADDHVVPFNGPADAITTKPMVVLINSSSASASEIVSGAMQGLKRAWIVGDRSFGKGSVQSGGEFPADKNLVLFSTVARFYMPVQLPNGTLDMRTNQRIGVIPDFSVPAKLGATPDETFFMREGDLYPYSLEAGTPTWESIRVSETQAISSCLEKGQRAEKALAAKSLQDYQLLKAEEVLACELGR
jgi:carboxyl-terminal processing protease